MDLSSWTPPAPPPPPHQTEGRRALKVVLVVFGAFTLTIGGCAAVAVVALDRAVSGFKLGPFDPTVLPPDVKPIPISTRACPALEKVRDTAGRAGSLWFALGMGTTDTHDTVSTEYATALLQFDAALHAAIPQVPEPIAADLLRTLAQVQIGERELSQAGSNRDYFSRTFDPVMTGNTSLGYALARVGNACGTAMEPTLNLTTPTSMIGG